jgi:glucose/arabinose dehydrogenase
MAMPVQIKADATMSTRLVTCLFRAAANAGVNVRLEFRSDGTIIATTGSATSEPLPNETTSELDKWLRKHNAGEA